MTGIDQIKQTVRSSSIYESLNKYILQRINRKSLDLPATEDKSLLINRKHLPLPNGPFTVGCLDLMTGDVVCGSFIRLFYPTENCDILTSSLLWPLWIPKREYAESYAYFRRYNVAIHGRLFKALSDDVYVPAVWLGPVLTGQKWPVIVFSHGLGGNRTSNTTLCVELASHGFVVAIVEHRDGSAGLTYQLRRTRSDEQVTSELLKNQPPQAMKSPIHKQLFYYQRLEREDDFATRNRQVYHRAQECFRALNILSELNSGKRVTNLFRNNFNLVQFRNKLDLDRAIVMGHSFGGATALCSLANEVRFRAAVCLDAWMLPLDDSIYEKLTQPDGQDGRQRPVLFLNNDNFQWQSNVDKMFRIVSKEMAVGNWNRVMVSIRDTCHQTQTDFQFVVNSKLSKMMQLRHKLKPSVAMELNVNTCLGFIRKHLDIPGDRFEQLVFGMASPVVPGALIPNA